MLVRIVAEESHLRRSEGEVSADCGGVLVPSREWSSVDSFIRERDLCGSRDGGFGSEAVRTTFMVAKSGEYAHLSTSVFYYKL